MEGGGEIIVADRPDTLRTTTLALAQHGQPHSYAKNSQAIAQNRRLHVFVAERTDIVILALEKTIEAFTLGITEFDPCRRAVEKNPDIEHTLPQGFKIFGCCRTIVSRSQRTIGPASRYTVHQDTTEKAVFGRRDQTGKHGRSTAQQQCQVGPSDHERSAAFSRATYRFMMIRLVQHIIIFAEILREHTQDRLHLGIDHAGGVGIVGFEQFHKSGLRNVTCQRKVSLFHHLRL